MSSTFSDSPTVLPTDSASNAPPPPSNDAPRQGQKGRGPRRSHKSAVDKAAPPGAVEVQPGGEKKTGKKSAVQSATIPLSGWGETDLASSRKDVRPEYTVDANPFMDLVEVTYENIQSRFSSSGKHIPFALFSYYCLTMWWYRVLFLHKTNGNTLSTEEKAALNILSAGEEFFIPAPIAQYLANMGNFQQGGETFYFRKLDSRFTGIWQDGKVVNGWLDTDDDIRVVSGTDFWRYAQLPVPGVYALSTLIEADSIRPAPGPRPDLEHVAPVRSGSTVTSTNNILGWFKTPREAHHSSWRSTYANLGWQDYTLPPDVQTVFNISQTTLKWMSEKLSTINGFKTHSSRQLTLSVQGNPIAAQWLMIPTPVESEFWWPSPNSIDDRRGTRHQSFGLASRYSMDAKFLSPSFCFGYRLQRTASFSKYEKGSPVFYGFSNFDPWTFHNEKSTARMSLPAGWWNNANDPFTLGSQPYINFERFSTHSLNRSAGMNAALILAAT